jgi:hypothetical protein
MDANGALGRVKSELSKAWLAAPDRIAALAITNAEPAFAGEFEIRSVFAYETRAYEVTVRFDDGTRGVFTYRDYTPFRPGDRIDLTPDGPRRVVY